MPTDALHEFNNVDATYQAGLRQLNERWQPRADLPALVIPLAEVLPPVGEAAPADAD